MIRKRNFNRCYKYGFKKETKSNSNDTKWFFNEGCFTMDLHHANGIAKDVQQRKLRNGSSTKEYIYKRCLTIENY
jgi:hypothetical protein